MIPTPTNDERLVPPVETIVIERLKNGSTMSSCMVIRIPPTYAEHNMIFELLKRLRTDYPGAWFCVQQWERQNFMGPITIKEPEAAVKALGGVKEVTREYLGLPPEDEIRDVA